MVGVVQSERDELIEHMRREVEASWNCDRDVSLADELISERRAEAVAEDHRP